MKLYRLTFSACGQITKIPDAQTIFGAMCAAIQMKEGIQKMEDYIHSFESEPWFVHTSMFSKGLIPACAKPLFSLSELSQTIGLLQNQDKLAMLAESKKFKKFQYVSETIFEDYILKDNFEDLKRELLNSTTIKLQQIGSLSVLQTAKEKLKPFLAKTVQQTRSGTLEIKKDKDLFYQKQMYLSESSELSVFVKSDWTAEQLYPYFSMLEFTGIGPYRSSGLNLFQLKTIEECCFDAKGDYAYLLSGCIPADDEFEFEKSFYKIESSSYRGSYSLVGNAFMGTFSKLKEGSLMKPVRKKEWYGRLIRVETNGKMLYHYGLGVTV